MVLVNAAQRKLGSEEDVKLGLQAGTYLKLEMVSLFVNTKMDL